MHLYVVCSDNDYTPKNVLMIVFKVRGILHRDYMLNDAQHYNIYHSNTYHNDSQHHDIPHNNKKCATLTYCHAECQSYTE
jgi:hypothetical protein